MRTVLSILFSLFVWQINHTFCQTTVILNDSTEEINLLPYYSFYIDKEGSKNIDQIKETTFEFQNKPEYGNFKYSTHTFWVKFNYNSSPFSVSKWYLTFVHPSLMNVKFYILKDSILLDTFCLGSDYQKNDKIIAFRSLAIKLRHTLGEKYTVYCRIKSYSAIGLFMRIVEEKKFINTEQSQSAYLILGFGIIIASFIFNFILFFLTRERMYLYYSLFLIFGISNLFVTAGFANLLDFGFPPELLSRLRSITFPCGSISLFLFTIKFFELKRNSLKMYRFVLAFISIYIVMIFMSLSPYPTLIMWVLKSVIIFFPMGAIIQIIVAVIVFQ